MTSRFGVRDLLECTALALIGLPGQGFPVTGVALALATTVAAGPRASRGIPVWVVCLAIVVWTGDVGYQLAVGALLARVLPIVARRSCAVIGAVALLGLAALYSRGMHWYPWFTAQQIAVATVLVCSCVRGQRARVVVLGAGGVAAILFAAVLRNVPDVGVIAYFVTDLSGAALALILMEGPADLAVDRAALFVRTRPWVSASVALLVATTAGIGGDLVQFFGADRIIPALVTFAALQIALAGAPAFRRLILPALVPASVWCVATYVHPLGIGPAIESVEVLVGAAAVLSALAVLPVRCVGSPRWTRLALWTGAALVAVGGPEDWIGSLAVGVGVWCGALLARDSRRPYLELCVIWGLGALGVEAWKGRMFLYPVLDAAVAGALMGTMVHVALRCASMTPVPAEHLIFVLRRERHTAPVQGRG